MTRRTFLAGAACTALAHAQTPMQSSNSRGKELIDKIVRALGGAAFRNMTGHTETGRAYSFYREQLSGLSLAHIYTKYLPDSEPGTVGEAQRQAFGKKLDDVVIFNPKGAWEITFRGAKPLPDTRFQQFQLSAIHDIFYILRMRVNEPGMVFEAKGTDVVENQSAQSVEIIDSENRSVTLWVHAGTFLPIKQLFKRWDPTINDRREEVTRYSKYRDVGQGIMWPYDTQRERDTEKIFELYADQVKVNEDMPQSMFEVPSGITILKK